MPPGSPGVGGRGGGREGVTDVALVVLLAHLGATTMMAGLIWFVQIVHYPLFAHVPAEQFRDYEQRHVARTGRVVGPLMFVEAVTTVWLLVSTPDGVPRWLVIAGVALLAVVWGSTGGVQVPLHRRLEQGWDLAAIRRLVRTNWVRTCAWTARAVIAAAMLVAGLTVSGPA